ncbi:hypothetical protein FB567DRAFT_547409 [Paraphoma chrysanthemicola]|uniref:DUF7896 domain-containing protein n=1 Tax=Paraphoma chrysanthemicola TaxID=798071 RepID=A0A8K0RCQ0_9PLEO|nr:hypothetical protein FB567DRAFT_547409 [Paraphoma chrysanthemicola]
MLSPANSSHSLMTIDLPELAEDLRRSGSVDNTSVQVDDTSENIEPHSVCVVPEISTDETRGGQLEQNSSNLIETIPKTPHVRPQVPRIRCPHCDERPEGFRGTHELDRHIARAHAPKRKGYICVDASEGKDFLANCKHCRNKKVYGAYYNAAAHLRRAHFHPRQRGRKNKNEEKRGGVGGGDDPPMDYLKMHWIAEIEVENTDTDNYLSTESRPQLQARPTDGGPLVDHTHDSFVTTSQAHSGSRTQTDLHVVSATKSDSGYHSGYGTDTASVCSVDSTGSSLGLPQDLLQNFIAFFGDMLIEETGAEKWFRHTLENQSGDEIEKRLAEILRGYAIDLASDSAESRKQKRSHEHPPLHVSEQDQQVLDGATRLIRRYRSRIARYVRNNAVPVGVDVMSFPHHLQRLGEPLSINERIGLIERSEFGKQDLPDEYLHLEAKEDLFDDGEAELCANLELVQNVLESSETFHRMTLELRRKLYHDDMESMDMVRLCIESSVPRPKETFVVDLALEEFMKHQYGDKFPSFGSIVVITGSALYAQATTCGQYLMQTWPETGALMTQLLDVSLTRKRTALVTTNVASGRLESSVSAEIRPSGDILVIVDGNDQRLRVEIAQQLAWIASALSLPPHGYEVAYAKPVMYRSTTTSNISEILIDVQHDPLHATETPCWLSLFSGAVIASGFPIADRDREVGLEISLDLLAGLAGVCHAVEFEGGVVMKGFSHLFVPVQKTSDRIQWHAVSSTDEDRRLTYREGLSRCGTRALSSEVSLHDIQQCRTIVGWCSTAKSRLGSDSITYESIDYSGAPTADSSIRCAGGTLGFQQIGTAGLSFRFGVKDGRCHFQRSGPYRSIITAAEITPIVLYDTGDRRAWLVPATDVMLHILQHRCSLGLYEIGQKRLKIDTNVPPDSSAKTVLLQQELLSLSEGGDYKFRDAILNIWSLIEFLIDENVTRDRNSPGATMKSPLRECLSGFEFKAVVQERSPFHQKQASLEKTHGGWPLLVRDIDALVLMANGFDDILMPADTGNRGLCRYWQRVPKGYDYMATSTKTVIELYDVAGCRLDRKYVTSTRLQWHRGASMLFEDCRETTSWNCSCNRLQRILPKSTLTPIVAPGVIAKAGAVIFGHADSTLGSFASRTRIHATNGSTFWSQNIVPLSVPINLPATKHRIRADHNSSSGDDGSSNTLSACSTITQAGPAGPATPEDATSIPFATCPQKSKQSHTNLNIPLEICNDGDDNLLSNNARHQMKSAQDIIHEGVQDNAQNVKDEVPDTVSSSADRFMQTKPKRSLWRRVGFRRLTGS